MRKLGHPSSHLKRLKKLLGQIVTMSGDRNALVHDSWLGHQTNNRAFQMWLKGKELHGEFKSVRIRDIRKLAIKIETKTAALRRLHDFLAPKVLPLLGILETQHEITLVSAKKVPRRGKTKAKPQPRPQSPRP